MPAHLPPAKQKSTSAFTLIELSIVLVIIGLIVGGVLVGRDLIHVAEIRATVKQIQQLDTAVNAFQLKYNCLPGDCSNGAAFGFPNGDGNGEINLYNSNGFNESIEAISLLQQEGLIAGTAADSYDQQLALPIKLPTFHSPEGYKGVWVVNYVTPQATTSNSSITKDGHYYVSSVTNIDGQWSELPVFLPIDAFAIDSKLDDGLPRSGTVLASGDDDNYDQYDSYDQVTPGLADFAPLFDPVADVGPAGAASDFCVTTSPNLYNVQNTSYDPGSTCSLSIKAAY